MMTWLFVAAERREFDGIIRRCGPGRKLDWPVAFARAVERHGRRWVLVADGPGTRLAGRAADVAAEREKELEAVISTGFCGALDAELKVGDIVVATRVGSLAARQPICPKPFAVGEILSMDRVAVSVAEKTRLGNTGALAVEMEAAGVAERAERWRLPFLCVRAVSDTAGERMPLNFNALRDGNGRFRRARIVGAALRRPFSALPGLLRLDRNCRKAAEALGEFFADCRF